MKRGFILSAILFASSSAFSDSGVGVSVQSNDSRILVPFNVSENFRMEPSLRYYKSENEDGYENEQSEVAVGFFHRKNTVESMIFLVGARIGYIRFSQGFAGSSDMSNDGYFIAPALGLEYFFGDKLSLGAEVSFRHESIDTGRNDTKSTYTDSALIARFYF